MTYHEHDNQKIVKKPDFFHSELELELGEMLPIAEAAKESFDAAVAHDAFVITDTVVYDDVPYLNGLSTPAVRLGLKGRKISKLSIQVPKKDTSTAITITAYDAINPNRKYILTEFVEEFGGSFIVDDTDWVNAQRAGRPVDTFLTQNEVAHWLYRQGGMSENEVAKKLEQESDPVQDAAHALSTRSTKIINQRQVRVDLSPSSQFFGEEISVSSPDELHVHPHGPRTSDLPIARPVRLYTTWINQGFETELYGNIKETLLSSFSPDNPALAIPHFSPGVSVQFDTNAVTHANDLPNLFLLREDYYKGGTVADMFKTVTQQILNSKKSTK